MEVSDNSRVPSTDFSIERILSEGPRDSRLQEQNSRDPTNWLCCTRYRPPRLPRTNSSSSSSSSGSSCRGPGRRAGRHARVPFTAAQAAALESAYARAPYLAPPALKALAAALNLRDDRIKIWFQNRRARERREKTSAVAPPQAVTLPATTPARLEWLATGDSGDTPRYIIPPSKPHIQVFFNTAPRSTEATDMPNILSIYEESSIPTSINTEVPFIEVSEIRPRSPILDVEKVADDLDESLRAE